MECTHQNTNDARAELTADEPLVMDIPPGVSLKPTAEKIERHDCDSIFEESSDYDDDYETADEARKAFYDAWTLGIQEQANRRSDK
jgi:hypothetical protein